MIRNPWDKVVSHYHYRVQTNQTDLGRKEVGFNDWVRLSYGEKDRRFYDNPKMFMPQMEWITGYKGEILINGFIHFESLNEDFQEVCRKIGKTAVLPHVKASSRGDYRSYYEDDTAEIIRTWFERDIEKFGYRF